MAITISLSRSRTRLHPKHPQMSKRTRAVRRPKLWDRGIKNRKVVKITKNLCKGSRISIFWPNSKDLAKLIYSKSFTMTRKYRSRLSATSWKIWALSITLSTTLRISEIKLTIQQYLEVADGSKAELPMLWGMKTVKTRKRTTEAIKSNQKDKISTYRFGT